MTKRQNNTPRITAAQQAVCEKLPGQTTRLVNTVGEAVDAGVPPDDCHAMIRHLLCGRQDPLPQGRRPAATIVPERIHSAMSALARHMPT